MTDSIYCNYILLDSRKRGNYSFDGLSFSLLYEPFYVGCGLPRRIKQHLNEARKGKPQDHPKIAKIRKIWDAGLEVFHIKPNINIPKDFSRENEIFLINSIGRVIDGTGTLVNFTLGGDGGNGLYGDENPWTKIWNSKTEEEKLEWSKFIGEKTKQAFDSMSPERRLEMNNNIKIGHSKTDKIPWYTFKNNATEQMLIDREIKRVASYKKNNGGVGIKHARSRWFVITNKVSNEVINLYSVKDAKLFCKDNDLIFEQFETFIETEYTKNYIMNNFRSKDVDKLSNYSNFYITETIRTNSIIKSGRNSVTTKTYTVTDISNNSTLILFGEKEIKQFCVDNDLYFKAFMKFIDTPTYSKMYNLTNINKRFSPQIERCKMFDVVRNK